MDSILLSDLDKVHEVGLIDEVLSNTPQDRVFEERGPLEATWSQETDALHHWASLRGLTESIDMSGVERALRSVEKRLARADALFARTRAAGVEYEPPAGNHIEQWREAVHLFRRHAELGAGD